MEMIASLATSMQADRERAVEKNSPREYILTDPAELQRLFREVHGYLRTCHSKHGTDWDGRKFAMDALDRLIERKAK